MNVPQEKNYDFRARHWQFHQENRRNFERTAKTGEVMIDASWSLSYAPDAPAILKRAVQDFQDYFLSGMDLSLAIIREHGEKTICFFIDPALDKGFELDVTLSQIRVAIAGERDVFRAVVHLEDLMNLEGAPVLPAGKMRRRPLYSSRSVHSGCGIDEYPDAELAATVHAGYDTIVVFLKKLDPLPADDSPLNDLIRRAANYGIEVEAYNYIRTFIHPDEPGAQEHFDRIYGELFRRCPGIAGIMLTGESLEFPSRDIETTGKPFSESCIDGIPDTRPSPGWYPCRDYPAYLACIERAVHRVKPSARIVFSSYNWGYAPLELRKSFLERMPKGIILSVCYEIFSRRQLENLRTPVMDYTCSATEPGYYFTSECAAAHELGIPLSGNVNTAGVAWDFGCVPYVPAPACWLTRCRNLRQAQKLWGVSSHYATHHYGWWSCVASDIGKWTAWEDFEPDYELLLEKIAIRDHGKENAAEVLAAWRLWSEAMKHYTASNEDQYGPWRVGAAYPLIFHPNVTRTMQNKAIEFPTAPGAHFGSEIIKTLYQPYENSDQSPGFLRYPAELRSLERMLTLWNQGLDQIDDIGDRPESARQRALGHFIRNSIKMTMHAKKWWLLNMKLQTSSTGEEGILVLDQLGALLEQDAANVRDTFDCVAIDSRLGWEASMGYVCDEWHLAWKLRQLDSVRRELACYRKCCSLA